MNQEGRRSACGNGDARDAAFRDGASERVREERDHQAEADRAEFGERLEVEGMGVERAAEIRYASG